MDPPLPWTWEEPLPPSAVLESDPSPKGKGVKGVSDTGWPENGKIARKTTGEHSYEL